MEIKIDLNAACVRRLTDGSARPDHVCLALSERWRQARSSVQVSTRTMREVVFEPAQLSQLFVIFNERKRGKKLGKEPNAPFATPRDNTLIVEVGEHGMATIEGIRFVHLLWAPMKYRSRRV